MCCGPRTRPGEHTQPPEGVTSGDTGTSYREPRVICVNALQFKTRIFLCPLTLRRFDRVVRGAIIHHNYFKGRTRLGQNGIQGPANKLGGVVDGNDNGDVNRSHNWWTSCKTVSASSNDSLLASPSRVMTDEQLVS